MIRKIIIFFGLLCPMLLTAQIQPQWIRYNAISPDGSQIVFTYKGDLYKVASEGGEAQQLTFHEAHDYQAVWSPDGQTLAFASERYGNFDIYVMPAAGGPATRLTFHSTNETPFTFLPMANMFISELPGKTRPATDNIRPVPNQSFIRFLWMEVGWIRC
jgi:tricorn protease